MTSISPRDRLRHRGPAKSPEHRAKLSAAMSGRKLAPEHIANISKALRGRPKPPRTKAHIDKQRASMLRTFAERAAARELAQIEG